MWCSAAGSAVIHITIVFTIDYFTIDFCPFYYHLSSVLPLSILLLTILLASWASCCDFESRFLVVSASVGGASRYQLVERLGISWWSV